MDNLTAAVIGCGRMGIRPASEVAGSISPGWLPLAHAEALVNTPGFVLAALGDAQPEARARAAQLYPHARIFSDHRELLAQVRPDFVTIATRTPPKAQLIADACSAGVRGLYVEKPLATSADDAATIIATCAAAGVVLGYGVNRRHHAAYREALRRVRDGEIGRLESITIEHGPGQLLWTHPHSTDLLLMFAGETAPESVQASLAPETVVTAGPLVVDSDPVIRAAMFAFPGGLTGQIVPGRGLNTRLSGTEGILTIVADGTRLDLDRKGSTYFTEPHRFPTQADARGATLTAFAELADAIRHKTPPPIPAASIGIGLRMLLACVWSHLRDGRRVSLDEIPAEFRVTGRYGEMFA